jgi:hypothetical protein
MLCVVLNWQKISKTISQKVFNFILWCFRRFLRFASKNLKMALLRGEIFYLDIGHIGYKKN